MNRRELIRRAIELGEKIDNEPNSTLQKVDWIIEKAKIECAEKLFNDVSSSNVRYHKVDSYETLLNIMKDIE